MSIDMPPEMSAGRPRVLNMRPDGITLMSMNIENPPSEFVDALRLCIVNQVACSFLPKIPESVDITSLQETLDRGGRHDLYVAFLTGKHDAGTGS